MDAFAEVRIILHEQRARGVPFDQAWYRALRQLVPAEEDSLELHEDHELMKPVLKEVKPFWRAAYEEREPTPAELRKKTQLEERRLRDLSLKAAA